MNKKHTDQNPALNTNSKTKISDALSHMYGANAAFVEEIYQMFCNDRSSVDREWAEFFEKTSGGVNEEDLVRSDYSGPSWAKREICIVGSKSEEDSKQNAKPATKDKQQKAPSETGESIQKKAERFINSYRKYGHLVSNLDPLNLESDHALSRARGPHSDISKTKLSFESCEITNAELDKKVKFNSSEVSISSLKNILSKVYAGNVGFEFDHMRNEDEKTWLFAKAEEKIQESFDNQRKIKTLKEIIRTEGFEKFIHKRFPGAKRFSVEGGDSAINSIERIVEVSSELGVKKIFIGMAHRGRLNVLVNVMGKPYGNVISEFQGKMPFPESSGKAGDVKYHNGYSSTREISGNKIDLSLAYNPSHLEAVNPVVAGKARATQVLFGDSKRKQVSSLLIHGDAAFAGQGIVAESLVMNGVSGYDTGGVMHLIINNQIGFTADSFDSRGSLYCSDLARAIDAPIIHVNGDDVELVVKVSELMVEYRQKFGKDAVIDLVCYRRYGHNEGDEPLYTQPVMYTNIKDHPTLQTLYSKKLIESGVIKQEEYDKLVAEFEAQLSNEFDATKDYKAKDADWLKKDWAKIEDVGVSIPNTSVPSKKLVDLMQKLTTVPADIDANPKVLKQFEARFKSVESGTDIDWGSAEALAFATLLSEGFPVRLSGQDAGRGTFSHRHSEVHGMKNGNVYVPLNNIGAKAAYEVYNSVLSEYGVLGFEYGYSTSMPYGLTIWEAQFGDFANGAQIMFDQFIAAAETKWFRKSGLVMLLPHGYEGQGPEHSSARLERYLQACAENNLIVANITNPANFFHVLRRQLHDRDRKPLVIMSPKSLLRHKLAVSKIEEFSEMKFRPLIPEESKTVDATKVKKVILCTGKIYYDLVEAREKLAKKDIALIRLEQLYPFPAEELRNELKKYKSARVVWCQEEPKNMGAWKFVEELIEEQLVQIKHSNSRPEYLGRKSSASTAVGYLKTHALEQEDIIKQAMNT